MHPLSLIIDECVGIFADLGFEVSSGPEMEDEKHNFDMLNFPADHPARDMQDTFFIKDNPGHVMRTHTSNVQARYMEALAKSGGKPPFAIVVPGKVFRNEATDASHEMQFFQIEGLMVGENISMAHLKGVLLEFFKRFIGDKADIRLRPSFFPFVEPGAEIDVKVGEKWVEMLGAGMVHPKVLSNVGINPRKYKGFAFGVGIERLAMVKYGVPDIRMFLSGDLRVTEQF